MWIFCLIYVKMYSLKPRSICVHVRTYTWTGFCLSYVKCVDFYRWSQSGNPLTNSWWLTKTQSDSGYATSHLPQIILFLQVTGWVNKSYSPVSLCTYLPVFLGASFIYDFDFWILVKSRNYPSVAKKVRPPYFPTSFIVTNHIVLIIYLLYITIY